MLAFVVVAVLLQSTPALPPQAAAGRTAATDSAGKQDSTKKRAKKPPKRATVTSDHLATAFADAGARSLLALARDARTRQDSALQSYDATTYQRVSAGLGFSRFGRDRLAFRSEESKRVRWRRGVGAYVEVTGQRTVMPIAGKSGNVKIGGAISPIPYSPGSETLWIGTSIAQQEVDENEGMVHPLVTGSEAYYKFSTGDSVTFRLPDGTTIRLRELKVRPRSPSWRLAVGSLWFDVSGGQLVRAAYRMSVPMDIKAVAEEDDPRSFEDVPAIMKPMMFPMSAQITAIGVEYGLYQGRFWLPRVQVAEGSASAGFVRAPIKLEQSYKYDQVNAGGSLPPIPEAADTSLRNGVGVSVRVGGGSMTDSMPPKTARDSARAVRRARQKCDSTGNRNYTSRRRNSPNATRVTISCDTEKLARSPDLPASIYGEDETRFNGDEIDALVKQALSISAQADFAPLRPTTALLNPRYNRIEGLSLGARADQELGAGYSAHALARIGVADWQPLAELTGARSDLRRTLSLTAYNRLVPVVDLGNPLSLGSSISSFLFGRDDAFYYRASGVELTSVPDAPSGGFHTWSLFAEQERTATQRTTFSLARAAYGTQFEPNIAADRGVYIGARTRLNRSFGLDPSGFRLSSDARLEGAYGDARSFGRITLDLTGSRAIGNGMAALTLAAGSGLGELPAQRLFYLGGAHTVRGQRPGGTPGVSGAIGEAFWLARGELARGLGVVKPVVFADLGWAGNRGQWRDVGRPMSGAGIGMTMLDGLLRFDLSRGIYPEKGFRVDTYVEARF